MDNKQQPAPLTEHPIAGAAPAYVPPQQNSDEAKPTPPVLPVTPTPILPQTPPAPAQPLPPQPPVAPQPPVTPQPVPSATLPRKELEQKAKVMVQELNKISPTKETQLPKRSPAIAALVVFLLVLVGGGGFAGVRLLQTQQSADTRQKAACDPTVTCCCYPQDETVCAGQHFTPTGSKCTNANICVGTKDCSSNPPTPKPTCATPPADQDTCTIGTASVCQKDASGQNTGYRCNCNTVSGVCSYGVWQCTTLDSVMCPGSGQFLTPKKYCTTTSCNVGSSFSATCYVNYYVCDGVMEGGKGCPSDGHPATSESMSGQQSASFKYECGNKTEQIDVSCGSGEFISHYAPPCATQPPQPSNTPPASTPTVSLSPTPEVLACTTIGYSNTNPNYGDTVTLTCTGTPNASVGYTYFQIKRPNDVWTDLTNATNSTAQFTVDRVGTYETRCRVCRTQDVTSCTAWQGASAN